MVKTTACNFLQAILFFAKQNSYQSSVFSPRCSAVKCSVSF